MSPWDRPPVSLGELMRQSPEAKGQLTRLVEDLRDGFSDPVCRQATQDMLDRALEESR